ncbi:atp-binding cassette superfamily [Nannochloropsis gaditana]|uniref:Atp-binding cassette superfamily n=1 Tax=Nannochloropsis gaditana TaxID=72520 RepID=W7TH06_9STRA|nr:atp-binding cassette superfamily [Nannochloropsis gaditana]
MFSKANQGAEVNNEILKRFSPTTEFDRKELLKHITMTVLPGEIAFVMGPSGAGKSTLLDALAGRIKDGVMSGHIYFNGRPRSSDFYSNSAYVRQDDVHIPNLTVGETLFFAAQLRLGGEYTINERQSRIKAVSDLLGLNSCILSLVGDAGMRGISGGQLKRLSIAVEIMNMPSLIFLDEPTSGLDSVMAHDVMTFTNRLADQNRTILATIHQPSSETYALASKVILVSAGRIMFCGPANEAQSYFISLGFSAQMFGNPADFIIAVVSGAEPSSSSTTGTKDTDAKSLSDLYEASKYFQVPATRSQIHSGARNIGSQPHAFPTSVTSQTYTLVNRFWIAQSRQWEFVVAQLGKNVVVASICGAIFFGQGREKSLSTFSNVSFNVSSLWYFAMLYTVLSCLQIIPQLFFFGVLYNRERSANVYSTFAYWAANAIVCVPLLLLSHVIFVEISYWMVGLYPNAACHLFALLVTFLNNLISFYCAQCIAAISPSAEVALAMFPLVFLFLGSFAGFTIPLGELPPGWKWASYISYPRWTYQALIINEFQYRADRTAVLTFYSFTGFNKYLALPILAAFIVLMNVFVYIGLLPKQSRLQFENQTSPAESPKDDAVIVVKKPPVLLTSPKSLTLDDFKIRSAQRFPSTTGLSLMFRDLQYSVGKSPDRAARILKGVSGHVFPGQMCALMGGSGAGKSTLLDLLAHRKTGGFITGEYYIGGQAEKPSSKWCSYVTQDNVHISLFTVRETLEFAALLRLKEGIPVEKRRERAEDVMKMLGLEDVADVPVGNALVKGISGGQARRLSIGVEIMHLPDVLFLDEPTTGLDSQISHEVMSSVRNIANHNRTVVCTIHSPSKAVYELFDSLLLLALGRQTYFGSAEAAPTYFSLLTLGWCMPIGKNPADFLMEANQGLLVASDGTRRTIRELNHLFLNSRNCMDIDGQIEETLRIRLINRHRSKEQQWEKAVDLPRRIRTDSIFATLTKPETYPRSTVAQMYILTMRQFRKAWKMVRIEPIEGMQIHVGSNYVLINFRLLFLSF